jgi:RNA polymerase sigma-70 factor (ECF subfamily)
MDEECFRRLHQTTERSLWGYIFNSTADAGLADDLCQEAYLRILSARSSSEPSEDYLRYLLFRIASNLIADHRRQARRSQGTPTEEPSTPSHEDAVLSEQHVRSALSQLREQDRKLLWLALVEKFTHREIAEQLSYREASVRPLLHQAKERIRQILKGTKR